MDDLHPLSVFLELFWEVIPLLLIGFSPLILFSLVAYRREIHEQREAQRKECRRKRKKTVIRYRTGYTY